MIRFIAGVLVVCFVGTAHAQKGQTSDPNAGGMGGMTDPNSAPNSSNGSGAQERSIPQEQIAPPLQSTVIQPPTDRFSNLQSSAPLPVLSCPFKSEHAEVRSLWDVSVRELRTLQSTDQACSNAITQMNQGITNEQAMAQAFTDPAMSERIQLRNAEQRLMVLTANPELNEGSQEASLLQREIETLRRTITQKEANFEARTQNQARQDLYAGVNSVLTNLPAVQQVCQGAQVDPSRIASAGLNLFAAASPVLFGGGEMIGAIASLLSRVVDLFQGPTRSERALELLSSRANLETLSCLYFMTMKVQCVANRGGGQVSRADKEKLVDLRRLFEDPSVNALGRSMRNMFNDIYGETTTPLASSYAAMVPQYCALMSAIPSDNRAKHRCPHTPGLTLYESCDYIDYYERGTTTGDPTNRPDFPNANPGGRLSQPRRGGGSSR